MRTKSLDMLESLESFRRAPSQEGAEALTQGIAAIAQKQSTPDLAKLTAEMDAVVRNMGSHVKSAHQNDSAMLKKMYARFGEMDQQFEHNSTAVQIQLTQVNKLRREHQECRSSQANQHASKESAENRHTEAVKATSAALRGLQKFTCDRESVNENQLDEMGQGLAILKEAMADYVEALEHQKLREDEYTAAKGALELQLQDCDVKQVILEQATCDLGRVGCAVHSATYATLAEDYEVQVKSQRLKELDRQQEWKATKRVQCALELWKKTSNASAGSVHNASNNFSDCFSKVVDVDHLQMEFNSTPTETECPSIQKRPCSAEYVAEYSELPSVAPAAKCKVFCEKVATLGSYGGGWTFVNEEGRSTVDIDDVLPIPIGRRGASARVPTYKVPFAFREVLVQRLSENWCDYIEQTGQWFGSGGALMGVQTEPSSFVYWSRDSKRWKRSTVAGSTIIEQQAESMESDGSVVKLSFPHDMDMLKVASYRSLNPNAKGNCIANGPVKYRVYIRKVV